MWQTVSCTFLHLVKVKWLSHDPSHTQKSLNHVSQCKVNDSHNTALAPTGCSLSPLVRPAIVSHGSTPTGQPIEDEGAYQCSIQPPGRNFNVDSQSITFVNSTRFAPVQTTGEDSTEIHSKDWTRTLVGPCLPTPSSLV